SSHKEHLLDGRKFLVYGLSKELRFAILRSIYRELLNKEIKGIKRLILLNKCLVIETTYGKPLWYGLGLALSDGSILGKNNIIFSTSKPYTIDTIVHGFNRIKIYIARYMLSTKTKKLISIINIVTRDPNIAQLLRRIKEDRLYIERFVNMISSDKNALTNFLSGVIDGDGSIDRDRIRISVGKRDPLYRILVKIFKNNTAYDEQRYMLRIKTRALRELGILNQLSRNVVSEHKRKLIERISRKRKRHDLSEIILDEQKIKEIVDKLDNEDIDVLNSFKFRKKHRYTYAFVSFNSRNQYNVFSLITKLFHKIESILATKLIDSIKEGSREYIIYNQRIVRLIQILRTNVNKRGR
ncbi:MAG: hypothetical protein ABWW65_02910, partial [Thermoprotei archaeon]